MNTRLLSAHLQPLHFWAPGPCQVSLKALEGGPSIPILVPFSKSGIRVRIGEAKMKTVTSSFLPPSPGCWSPLWAFKLLGSQSPVSSLASSAAHADGCQQCAGSSGIPLCKAAGSAGCRLFPILQLGTFIASQA